MGKMFEGTAPVHQVTGWARVIREIHSSRTLQSLGVVAQCMGQG